MSAQFLAASSQLLQNTTVPVKAVPFSVGMWVRPTTTGTLRTLWALGNDPLNYYAIWQWTSNFNIQSSSGGTDADCLAGTPVANAWHYVVGRFISATNRRASVLNSTGVTAFAQNTTNQINTISLEFIGCDISGSANFFSGQIAEFWKTNTDIQPDGLALQDVTLRQLAYGGPFSIPYIRKDIVEYHSFIRDLSSATFTPGEDILPPLGETITATNTPIIGLHPPLPYWYARPLQNGLAQAMMLQPGTTGAPPALVYPQLERGIRGLNRGLVTGGYH